MEILRCRAVQEALSQDLLSAVWLGELSRLLPELMRRVPDLPSLIELPPEQQRRYLFSGNRVKTQPFTEVGGAIAYNGDDGVQIRDLRGQKKHQIAAEKRQDAAYR